MTTWLCVDPGTRASGYVRLDSPTLSIRTSGKPENTFLSAAIRSGVNRSDLLLIETPAWGQQVGYDLVVTILWIGRFIEAWGDNASIRLVNRSSVKSALGVRTRAPQGVKLPSADTQVRQALIDHFGGEERAIGNQKCPACGGKGGEGRGKLRTICPTCHGLKRTPKGPLAQISRDVWAALALGIAYSRGVQPMDPALWSGRFEDVPGASAQEQQKLVEVV